MAKSVVLFGGTFDPVHHGHLIIARAAAEDQGLDKVTLLPAASPPHKDRPSATGRQRLDMLRLAVEGDSGFDICDIELGRTGPSYTIDTVGEIRRHHGADADIRLIIGGDMLADLPNWHRAEELVEQVGFIIAARRPWSDRLEEVFRELSESFGSRRADQLRQSVAQTPLIEISSTQIRQRIAENLSVAYLTPYNVADYIRSKGLYRG